MNRRSVWAVAAGILVIVVVTTLVDVVLDLVGFYPSSGPIDDVQAWVGTIYRVVIGILGAWLTARLAPHRPLVHAMVLGAIGTILGLVGVLVTWNQDLAPRWYALAHVVLAIPEAWSGGKIHELQSGKLNGS